MSNQRCYNFKFGRVWCYNFKFGRVSFIIILVSCLSLFASSCCYHAVHLVLSFFISGFCLDSDPIVFCLDQFFTQIFSLKKILVMQTFCRSLTHQVLPPERNCSTNWEWVSDDDWILIWACDEHRPCSCMYLFIIMSYQDLAELSWWEELGPCAKCCNRVTSGVSGVVRNKLQFSQRAELFFDPLVTRTVGLYVTALAWAGLPAALVLEKPSVSCSTVSGLAVQFPVLSSWRAEPVLLTGKDSDSRPHISSTDNYIAVVTRKGI